MKLTPTPYGIACQPEDSRDGFKGRETWLLEGLNASYSHRRGYVISASKLPVLEWLLANGWHASRRLMTRDVPATFAPESRDAYRDGITWQQVRKLIASERKTAPKTRQNHSPKPQTPHENHIPG